MSLKRSGGSAGFNRRDFLRGSSAAAAAAALAAPKEPAHADDGDNATVVSGWVTITLTVNDEARTVKVEPRTTLLEVLRDKLNLTGCKDLQDVGADGADTVLIDGKATHAGSLLALSARGKRIETVESLRKGGQIDPVVEGFVQHDAMQCGFCTPGFVMATKAFVTKNPGATLEQIQEGLGGNICRCGTYHGITACAMQLVKQ
jgi:xanthine dehydrogenase YagT iron-sulfur-binding subunit